MSALARARLLIDDLQARGLRRSVRPPATEMIDFASNDYLGLSRNPLVLTALREARVVGSGGSRLLSGAHCEHEELETALARFVRRERALLFSSGYLAGMGALHTASHLVESSYSDSNNHACLIDGLRLTRLDRHVFPHLHPPRREERTRPALIVSETVFGMSGERSDVAALLAEVGPEDLLILDEAHALGVHGERGSGLASAFDDERIVIVGTLSKAFGCSGGFIAGPAAFIEAAINTARGFIFDTAMPPSLAHAALAALQEIIAGEAARARLRANILHVTSGLQHFSKCDDHPSVANDERFHKAGSPIIPLIIGDAQDALETSMRLREAGIHAPAIRPPTVAPGTARIRLVIRADHTSAQIGVLLSALRSTLSHNALSSAVRRSL